MMAVRRIVSNTGPLISLEKLRQGYDFIRQLYDTIIIPPGVLDEVTEGQFATPHAYLQHRKTGVGLEWRFLRLHVLLGWGHGGRASRR